MLRFRDKFFGAKKIKILLKFISVYTDSRAQLLFTFVYGGGKQIAVYGFGGKQRAVNVNMFTLVVNKLL